MTALGQREGSAGTPVDGAGQLSGHQVRGFRTSD